MVSLSISGSSAASQQITQKSEALQKSSQRIASGSRLARPEEDAAGVAVSANLSALISRLEASSEGLQNLSSFAQTSDGYLSTVQQQLTRMSELAQRATDGTLSTIDRGAYDLEFQQLKEQIGTITQNASFNENFVFQNGVVSTGLENGATVSFKTSNTGSPASLGISALQIDSASNAQSSIVSLTQSIQTLSTRRAEVGADLSQIYFNLQNTRRSSSNTTESRGRIVDLDLAEETTRLSAQSILQKVSISILAQSNRHESGEFSPTLMAVF